MDSANNGLLVTVCVIAYNSSRFIIETLESIKAQTYSNIKLIVSDDCSQDNTVELCTKWIKENGSRFFGAEIITVDKNTGTSGNGNRALAAAPDGWIKFIAGDDILFNDAISKYVSYIEKNPHVSVVLAEPVDFEGDFSDKKFSYAPIAYENTLLNEKITAQEQYHVMSKFCFGSGPTFFFRKAALLAVGGFDERFPLLDDYPLFIKLTKRGYKMYLLKEKTVYKRLHDSSVTQVRTNYSILSSLNVRMAQEYKIRYKLENANFIWRILLHYSLFLDTIIIKMGNSKKSLLCIGVYTFKRITDPVLWYERRIRWIDKQTKKNNK